MWEMVTVEQSQEYLFNSYIFKITISPDQRTIVSVGEEGAIFMWKMPNEVVNARADNELPTISKEKANDPLDYDRNSQGSKKSS